MHKHGGERGEGDSVGHAQRRRNEHRRISTVKFSVEYAVLNNGSGIVYGARVVEGEICRYRHVGGEEGIGDWRKCEITMLGGTEKLTVERWYNDPKDDDHGDGRVEFGPPLLNRQ